MKRTVITILIAITVLISIIVFSVKCNGSSSSGYIHKDMIPVGEGAFVGREIWNALAPINTTSITEPVSLVILAQTIAPFCRSMHECSRIVKLIQECHLRNTLYDIAYNFVIGGDANVYVGRGWDIMNSERNDSMLISFIGNFSVDEMSPEMIQTTQALLTVGVEEGKLIKNYTLVCHNQTSIGENPGHNIYSVVKNWPHFSENSFLNY